MWANVRTLGGLPLHLLNNLSPPGCERRLCRRPLTPAVALVSGPAPVSRGRCR
jgi:hypothetical protein